MSTLIDDPKVSSGRLQFDDAFIAQQPPATTVMPLTIDQAFAVCQRSAEEAAGDAARERMLEENRTCIAANDALVSVRRLREHLTLDDPTGDKRFAARDALAEIIEVAQATFRENEAAIARWETRPLPFRSAA